MDLQDIQAVITSAKARGREPLERYIRNRLSDDAEDDEVTEAATLAVRIIEMVPLLLARAAQEAERRELETVVQPLLDHAAGYFLQPLDVIPEMTQGLAGLLDDAYLVLTILQRLNRGEDPLLEEDLAEPLTFLRALVGPRVVERLDRIVVRAEDELSESLALFWARTAHQA